MYLVQVRLLECMNCIRINIVFILEVVGASRHNFQAIQMFLHDCGQFCGVLRLSMFFDSMFDIL